MRRFAPPHVLLAGYCAGLCMALVWRPPASLLAAAFIGVALATFGAAARLGRGPAVRGPAWSAICMPGLVGALLLVAGLTVGTARLVCSRRLPDRQVCR